MLDKLRYGKGVNLVEIVDDFVLFRQNCPLHTEDLRSDKTYKDRAGSKAEGLRLEGSQPWEAGVSPGRNGRQPGVRAISKAEGLRYASDGKTILTVSIQKRASQGTSIIYYSFHHVSIRR